MSEVKPGNQTSEYLLTKYGTAITVAAPIVAAVAAKAFNVEVTAEQVIELANNAIIAIAAIVSSYSIGRSIVKKGR